MANVVKFNMKQVPAALSEMFVRVTDLDRNELFAGVKPISGNAIELDLGSVGAVGQGVLVQGDNFLKGSNESSFKSFSGYGIVEGIPEGILKSYDTIVGVGDSITAGEYDLAGGQYDTPYRGVNFRTGAEYGTTLFQMIENISDFTNQAEGKTLFIVRAGINDCNTYLAPGGVSNGSLGDVLSWDDLIDSDKELSLNRYRELIALLKEHGDVALSTITYCNAKGLLLPMPDKGRELHSGSWNDNATVPLCRELTPDWFDESTQRPKLDYYKVTFDNPDTLDNDNLHFYDDRTFTVPEGLGYSDGPGSYTVRQETLKQVGINTAMPSTPFDTDKYSNRLLVNIGRGNGLIGRPSFQRWANNLSLSSAKEVYENLNSYNGETDISMESDFSANGSVRSNIYTTDQGWSEGAGDTNNCSSGIYTASSILTSVFTGVGRGTVSMVGIFSSSGNGGVYDPSIRTIFEIEDDNGVSTVEVPSSLDGNNVTIEDCTGYIDFNCSVGGVLKVTPKPANGSQYCAISSICIDLQ